MTGAGPTLRQLYGRILSDAGGWVEGWVRFERRIEAVIPAGSAEAGTPKAGGGRHSPDGAAYILPGFIDLHVHGGNGADCMEGEAAVRAVARFHARHGTTALLAATVTAPIDDIVRALEGIRRVHESPGPGEARVLGAHLEGPFISPARLGAQPPFPLAPDREAAQRLLCAGPVRVVTLAPELPHALELITWLAGQGVSVQVGHSDATAEQVEAALAAGARGFTHLFNAMSGLHHRRPGVVGAALVRGRWAELIADGLHVHPTAARVAMRAVSGLYLVTDAVAAAGMPEGVYALGRHRVYKRGEGVYLEEGTLAGSTLTLDRALRQLVAWGVSLDEAARRVSTVPADYLGLADRGRIAPGAWADLVVLSPALEVEQVYVEGEPIFVRAGPLDAQARP